MFVTSSSNRFSAPYRGAPMDIDDDDFDFDFDRRPQAMSRHQVPPSATGYPSSTTGYPSSTTGYPSSTTGYPSSTTGYPSSTTGYPSSTIGYPSSTTGYQPATTGYPPASGSYTLTQMAQAPSPFDRAPRTVPTTTPETATARPVQDPYGQNIYPANTQAARQPSAVA